MEFARLHRVLDKYYVDVISDLIFSYIVPDSSSLLTADLEMRQHSYFIKRMQNDVDDDPIELIVERYLGEREYDSLIPFAADGVLDDAQLLGLFRITSDKDNTVQSRVAQAFWIGLYRRLRLKSYKWTYPLSKDELGPVEHSREVYLEGYDLLLPRLVKGSDLSPRDAVLGNYRQMGQWLPEFVVESVPANIESILKYLSLYNSLASNRRVRIIDYNANLVPVPPGLFQEPHQAPRTPRNGPVADLPVGRVAGPLPHIDILDEPVLL